MSLLRILEMSLQVQIEAKLSLRWWVCTWQSPIPSVMSHCLSLYLDRETIIRILNIRYTGRVRLLLPLSANLGRICPPCSKSSTRVVLCFAVRLCLSRWHQLIVHCPPSTFYPPPMQNTRRQQTAEPTLLPCWWLQNRGRQAIALAKSQIFSPSSPWAIILSALHRPNCFKFPTQVHPAASGSPCTWPSTTARSTHTHSSGVAAI